MVILWDDISDFNKPVVARDDGGSEAGWRCVIATWLGRCAAGKSDEGGEGARIRWRDDGWQDMARRKADAFLFPCRDICSFHAFSLLFFPSRSSRSENSIA